MRSGPKEGDELTLEEFLNLPAIAQRTSEGLEKLTKLKLIALLAHKMGVHEDPTLPEVLRNIIDFEFSINGVRPWKMEIEMTARAVLGVGQRFLGKIE